MTPPPARAPARPPRAARPARAGAGLVLLLAGAHAANDAFANALPVFLPLLQERFGLREAALATFVAVVSVSSNVLQAFVGALADRWGRRRVAALGLGIGSLLMSLIAVAPSPAALLALLAVGGLGSAAFHPSAASMARAAAGGRAGLGVGMFTAGGPIGAALMPVAALGVLRAFGAAWVPALSVVGVALAALLAWRAPRQATPPRAARPALFDAALFRGPVGALALAGILRSVAFISFMNAMPLFLVHARGAAPDGALIAWTLTVYSAASAAGVLLSGALDGRAPRRALVVGSMLLAVPLLASTLALPAGGPAFWAAVALAGLLTNAPIPLLVVSAQDLAPHAVATASGMLMGFTWGVAGVLYIGFGALQELLGIGPALLAGYAALLPAAGLAGAVLRSRPGAA